MGGGLPAGVAGRGTRTGRRCPGDSPPPGAASISVPAPPASAPSEQPFVKSCGRISMADWLEPCPACPDVHAPLKRGHSWGSLPPRRPGFAGEAGLCLPLGCGASCRSDGRAARGRPTPRPAAPAPPSAGPLLPLGTRECFHGNRTVHCASRKRLRLICVELGSGCGACHRGGARRGKGRICMESPIFLVSQGLHYFRLVKGVLETGSH